MRTTLAQLNQLSFPLIRRLHFRSSDLPNEAQGVRQLRLRGHRGSKESFTLPPTAKTYSPEEREDDDDDCGPTANKSEPSRLHGSAGSSVGRLRREQDVRHGLIPRYITSERSAVRPVSAQTNSLARDAAELHEKASGGAPGAYPTLAAQAPDPLARSLSRTALAPIPASPTWSYLRRSSSSSLRKRRRACGALWRQSRRCSLAFSRTPASAGSALGSSSVASDLEGRGKFAHPWVLPPVQLANDLHPEYLGPRISQTSERFQTLEAARVSLLRKCHDQV